MAAADKACLPAVTHGSKYSVQRTLVITRDDIDMADVVAARLTVAIPSETVRRITL
jgi:hypothetical protein